MSVTSAEKAEPAVPRNISWEWYQDRASKRLVLTLSADLGDGGGRFFMNDYIRYVDLEYGPEGIENCFIHHAVEKFFAQADKIMQAQQVAGGTYDVSQDR